MSKTAFCGDSHTGRVRTNNEDAFIVQNIWDDNHILAAAIDGVGGYEGGEVAADTARRCIVEYLENYPNGERLELLKQAVIYANNTIFTERKRQPQYGNMSCVLTAVLVEIKERRINMAHIGDTRLYCYTYEGLTKLSHDHSLIGYREEIGELSEEDAMHHPQRNIISRDVGSTFLEQNGSNYVETATFPLSATSTFLLCSDGLCDMLTSAQITDVLRSQDSVNGRVAALIDAANNAGGKDNITVVLVDVDIEDDSKEDHNITKTDMKHTDTNTQMDGKDNYCKIKTRWLLTCILLAFLAGICTRFIHKDSHPTPSGEFGFDPKNGEVLYTMPSYLNDTVEYKINIAEDNSGAKCINIEHQEFAYTDFYMLYTPNGNLALIGSGTQEACLMWGYKILYNEDGTVAEVIDTEIPEDYYKKLTSLERDDPENVKIMKMWYDLPEDKYTQRYIFNRNSDGEIYSIGDFYVPSGYNIRCFIKEWGYFWSSDISGGDLRLFSILERDLNYNHDSGSFLEYLYVGNRLVAELAYWKDTLIRMRTYNHLGAYVKTYSYQDTDIDIFSICYEDFESLQNTYWYVR